MGCGASSAEASEPAAPEPGSLLQVPTDSVSRASSVHRSAACLCACKLEQHASGERTWSGGREPVESEHGAVAENQWRSSSKGAQTQSRSSSSSVGGGELHSVSLWRQGERLLRAEPPQRSFVHLKPDKSFSHICSAKGDKSDISLLKYLRGEKEVRQPLPLCSNSLTRLVVESVL